MMDVLTAPITSKRQELWASRSQIPFDPFESAKEMTSKTLKCPRCSAVIVLRERVLTTLHLHSLNLVLLAYMDDNGTGYLQEHFFLSCPDCHLAMSKGTFAVAKLAEDLVAPEGSPNYYLACVLAPRILKQLPIQRLVGACFLNSRTALV